MDFSSTLVLSSTSNECTSDSVISRNIVLVYLSIYGLLLIIVSIYSFKTLNQDPKFNQKSYIKQFKAWILDLKKRKSCYIPIIAHIFDQLTDISVAIQFYEIATNETKFADEWAACNGLNIWYLFILTVMSLIIYRLITGYLIYQYTNKSITRLLSQIFDVELFRSLYINYLCGKTEPCDPQRWITAMEAALESTPQSLIQLIYLVKTGAFDVSNILIVISLISSLWSIVSKLIADDKAMVYKSAKYFNFKFKLHSLIDFIIGLLTMIVIVPVTICCCCCMFIYALYPDNEHLFGYTSSHRMNAPYYSEIYLRMKNESDIKMKREDRNENIYTVSHPKTGRKDIIDLDNYDSKKWLILYNEYDRYISGHAAGSVDAILLEQWYCPRSFSWFYLFRVIWRILDVTSRLFIMVLTWLVIGGLSLGIIIGLECIAILAICIKSTHWELIIGIIASVVSLAEETKPISMMIFIYRTISNQIIMILISVWLFQKFECPKCTDYVYREELSQPTSSIFAIFIYCWISAVLSPIIFIFLFGFEIFIDGKTTSRALDQMIATENWDGILEIQLYAEQYGIYDEQNGKILLELAMDQRREAIISYLLHKRDESILPKKFFDSYMEKPDIFTPKNTRDLIKIYPQIMDQKDANGCNILDAYSRNPRFLHCTVLQLIYEQSPNLVDEKGRNGLVLMDDLISCYAKDPLLLTNGDLFYIQEKQPQLMEKLFCAASSAGNVKYIQHVLVKHTDMISVTSLHKLLDDYVMKLVSLNIKCLDVIHKQHPELIDKIFTSAISANNKLFVDKIIPKMNALKLELSSIERLLDYYSRNPSFLNAEDLIQIEKQKPELSNKLFACSIDANNKEYVDRVIINIKSMNINMVSMQKLFDYYLQNPSFLTTYNLIEIEKQIPELVNYLFLYSVFANNKEYYSEVISKMPEKVTLFTDSNGKGLYHYVSLRGGKVTDFQDIVKLLNTEHIEQKTESHDGYFHYKSDFDENGLFFYLGTNFGAQKYQNPADIGMVQITDKSGTKRGYIAKLINGVVGRGNSMYYEEGKKSDPPYIVIRVPMTFKVSQYTLKHCYWTKYSHHIPLRNWELQCSINGINWTTISKHVNDASLPKKGGTHTWSVDCNSYFEYFRLLMTDQKEDGKWILPLSGIEFYGMSGDLDPVLFYKQYPFCLGQNGISQFFQCAQCGFSKIVEEVIKTYPQLLNTTDENDKNILDYYHENNQLLNDEILKYIYEKKPNLVNKNGVHSNVEIERKQQQENSDDSNGKHVIGKIKMKKEEKDEDDNEEMKEQEIDEIIEEEEEVAFLGMEEREEIIEKEPKSNTNQYTLVQLTESINS